jgi:hypothetical protein
MRYGTCHTCTPARSKNGSRCRASSGKWWLGACADDSHMYDVAILLNVMNIECVDLQKPASTFFHSLFFTSRLGNIRCEQHLSLRIRSCLTTLNCQN